MKMLSGESYIPRETAIEKRNEILVRLSKLGQCRAFKDCFYRWNRANSCYFCDRRDIDNAFNLLNHIFSVSHITKIYSIGYGYYNDDFDLVITELDKCIVHSEDTRLQPCGPNLDGILRRLLRKPASSSSISSNHSESTSRNSSSHHECPRRFAHLSLDSIATRSLKSSTTHSSHQSLGTKKEATKREEPVDESNKSSSSYQILDEDGIVISYRCCDTKSIPTPRLRSPSRSTSPAEPVRDNKRAKLEDFIAILEKDRDFYREANVELTTIVVDYRRKTTATKKEFMEARAEWQSQMKELKKKHERELVEKEASLQLLRTINQNTINIKKEIFDEPLNENTMSCLNAPEESVKPSEQNILSTLGKRSTPLKRHSDITTAELEAERHYENHVSILSQEVSNFKDMASKWEIECEQLKNDKREMGGKYASLRSDYIAQSNNILQLLLEKNKIVREKEKESVKIQELTKEFCDLKEFSGNFHNTSEMCRSQLTAFMDSMKVMESNVKQLIDKF